MTGAGSQVTLDEVLNLTVLPGFSPERDMTWTLIDNQSDLSIIGTFSGLAEGAEVTLNGRKFQLSYKGGSPIPGSADGNDVVLTAINNPPVAVDDFVAVATDTPTVIAVKANDTDVDGDTLTVTAVTQGANGTVTLSGGVVTYTPNSLFTGLDSFTYTISDGNGGTDTATVTVRVDNHAPMAMGDSTSVHGWSNNAMTRPGGASVSGNVLSGASDPDGDTLTASLSSNPSHGTVTVAANGDYTYSPDQGYLGSDSFQFQVDDGFGGTDLQTITIDVTNMAPMPGSSSGNNVHSGGSIPISVSISDTDGDPLVVSITQPHAGLTSVTYDPATHTFTYVAPTMFQGVVTVEYTVDDGFGSPQTGYLYIYVYNNDPTANDGYLTTFGGTPGSIDLASLVSDTDGDAVTITGVGGAVQGSVSLSGTLATFSPTGTPPGTGWFTYSISDGHGGTANGVVWVTIM